MKSQCPALAPRITTKDEPDKRRAQRFKRKQTGNKWKSFYKSTGKPRSPKFSGYAIEQGTGTQRTPSMGLKKNTPRAFNRES